MERKYIFRGYDIVGNKGWVYGDLAHNQKITRTGLQPRTMVAGYEVAPESVGQFTGVTDSGGKDVYEGDILEMGEFGLYKGGYITFFEGRFGIMGEYGAIYNIANAKYGTIIGNVYENNN